MTDIERPHGAEDLANSRGQVGPPGEVRGMDIPTRYFAETPLIYKAPVTIVEGFERNISQYLCRWLDHAALPCMGTPTSVKSLKSPVSETHLTPGSPPQVSGSELGGSGGHRRQSMRQRHGILIGWVAVGRADLGSHTRPRCNKADGAGRDPCRGGGGTPKQDSGRAPARSLGQLRPCSCPENHPDRTLEV